MKIFNTFYCGFHRVGRQSRKSIFYVSNINLCEKKEQDRWVDLEQNVSRLVIFTYILIKIKYSF